MRFCTECGNNLPGAPEAAAAPAQPASAQPASAQPAPVASGHDIGHAVAAELSGAIGGPLCWRCRGVGDANSEFCKFCGARYADGGAEAPAPAAPAPAAPAPAAHAAPSPGPAPAPAPTNGARVVSILKDGSDGQAYPIVGEQTDIGSSEGDVILPDDPYLSPRHARVKRRGDGYTLRDLASVNGVYARVKEPIELHAGDRILIGQQVLTFEVLSDAEIPLGPASTQGVLVFGTPEVPRFARLVQYTTEGVGRDVHYLYRDETVLGRENGDIVFTDDPFLSRRHASISIERGAKRCVLKDLGSSNGTSIRVSGERPLRNGDHFRVGRHLFRFDAQGGNT